MNNEIPGHAVKQAVEQVVIVQVEEGLGVVDVGEELRQVRLVLAGVLGGDFNVGRLHVASEYQTGHGAHC